MMDWGAAFTKAREYDAFLDQYASDDQRARWDESLSRIQLSVQQKLTLSNFAREVKVLLFAATWCGDCIEQCPILQSFANHTDRLNLRVIDRDEDPALREAFLLCGAPRVPQAVFLSEDDQFVSRTSDKTLAKYRQMGARLDGASCSTGLVGIGGDPVFEAVVQDWLDEAEHAHWVVRLSPRLRTKHRD